MLGVYVFIAWTAAQLTSSLLLHMLTALAVGAATLFLGMSVSGAVAGVVGESSEELVGLMALEQPPLHTALTTLLLVLESALSSPGIGEWGISTVVAELRRLIPLF